MITLRQSEARGHFEFGWLDTRHTQHSGFNASTMAPVHFLQIWILPERAGLPPRYDQVAFQEADLRNRLRLIACPDGAAGSVKVFQDLQVYAARLDPEGHIQASVPSGRAGFLQVARGRITLNGIPMHAGDGARIEGEPAIAVVAAEPSEILLFDLA